MKRQSSEERESAGQQAKTLSLKDRLDMIEFFYKEVFAREKEGQRMKVREVMSVNVITVSARSSLQEALRLMMDHKIRRMPVVEGQELVGMVVQNDIEKALRRPGVVVETPIEWVMSKQVYTVDQEDDIIDVARLMNEKKISGIPVMNGDQLSGIITDSDLLKLLIQLMQREK